MRPPRRRRLRPFNLGGHRASRRTRLSLALVFATVFAPGAAPRARSECVPFADQQTLPAATSVVARLTAADIDGDGDLDAVGGGSAWIGWMSNGDGGGGGDGTSWSTHTVGTFGEIVGVRVVDLDRDGDLDLLAPLFYDGVRWYENLAPGDGSSWTGHTIASIEGTTFSAVEADLDGDGDLDVVSSNPNYDALRWHQNGGDALGDGDASVWSLHTISASATKADGPFSVAVADVDRDGDLDVLASSLYDDRISWFESDGAGGGPWTAHEIATGFDVPASVFAADVDGDGDSDVGGVARNGDEVSWFENLPPGDGSSWAGHTIGTIFDPNWAAPADVDGDGDLDVVWAAFSSFDISWWENAAPTGDGSSWSRHVLSGSIDNVVMVAPADLDGDGDSDVLAAFDGSVTGWYRNDRLDGEALLASPATIGIPWGGAGFAVADVDGDGDLDAVVGALLDNSVTWHENLGDAASWTLFTIATDVEAQTAHAADVDQDGDLDVVVAIGGGYAPVSDAVVWYENAAGDGSSWSPHTLSSTASGAYDVIAADLDRDGDLDVLASLEDAGALVWYRNLAPGDGTAWTLVTISTAYPSPRLTAVGDMDGDGDLDAFATWDQNQRIAWYENDGAGGGAWTEHEVETNSASPIAVAVADVDGDGDLDALTGAGGGLVAFDRNLDGSGDSWSRVTVLAAGSAVRDVRAADADGDGDLDVLWVADAAAGWAENLDGSGGTWTTHALSSSAESGAAIRAADLDGDGDLDPVWTSFSAGRIAWAENLGTRVFAAGFDSETDASANLGCWSTSVP